MAVPETAFKCNLWHDLYHLFEVKICDILIIQAISLEFRRCTFANCAADCAKLSEFSN